MVLLAFAFFIVSFLFFCLAPGFEHKIRLARLEQPQNELQKQLEGENERSERLDAWIRQLQAESSISLEMEGLDREELDRLRTSLVELQTHVRNQIRERSSGDSASSSSAEKKFE
ncbi:hypothetical protein RchiOBHm_Chr5g0010871 [Rosa chinensis]|uniref:Uncharacterized protein n=1 Tax=Rosa chinensis TaxID=74649 RepID=A0A2P6Q4P7_ROSCH|nr:hypothetical protein RchiOBHm_Chr5g0010871 [Rosa chinensis]